jgi:hypothetical protein
LLQWLKDYISERKQHVLLNNSISTLGTLTAGVPQGSVLDPLLFLNDIAYDIQSLLRLFSDDSSLIFSYINSLEVEDRLNLDLQVLDNRAKQWLVDVRERPFNLKGRWYVPEFNISLYEKNSESDYFVFLPPKSEYFFQ